MGRQAPRLECRARQALLGAYQVPAPSQHLEVPPQAAQDYHQFQAQQPALLFRQAQAQHPVRLHPESTTGRALSSKTYADDGMTLESCASFCSPFSMFGVEYGRECYCGNSLGAGSVKATNQADCNFLCPGDKTTYCGAGSRLQLYSVSASSSSST